MTKKEMEDFINKHRVYPREYKGIRDEKIINLMHKSYRYNNGYITCPQGSINGAGDFVLDREVRFHLDNPDEKIEIGYVGNRPLPLERYNRLVSDAGLHSKIIIPYEQNTDWNIRDMVAEIDVLKDIYLDHTSEQYKIKDSDPDEYNKVMLRIWSFITKFKPYIDDYKTTVPHGSKYDNL